MNKVLLIGRLTADPDLRTTNSGKNVCEFTLAIDRYENGEKKADFIRCTAWNKQADNLCRYKHKGDLIAVSGSLRIDKYKDRNGNDQWKTTVTAYEIEFVGGTQPQPGSGTVQPDADPDDDFPFE